MNSHEAVVNAFNQLGYTASFAAVALHLANATEAKTLYLTYPSREILGEMWLSEGLPQEPSDESLHEGFTSFVLAALERLNGHRDFSLAWLSSLQTTGPLHLPQIGLLHDGAAQYFNVLLTQHNQRNDDPGSPEHRLSLAENVTFEDVGAELVDAMCALTLWLVAHWASDRSVRYERTRAMVRSVGYLLDALLIARPDFNQTGLLWHLHRLYGQQRIQFIEPLLDLLMKPERAARLADPLSLLEILRSNRPAPAQRE